MSLKLTDDMIRLMSADDRRRFGVQTLEEAVRSAEIESERELHNQVRALLEGQRGIVVFASRPDRRTTRPVGEPDFLFAVHARNFATKEDPLGVCGKTVACAWELKMPKKELDPAQKDMFARLSVRPNAWICRVIRSVDEALEELRRLGLP